MFDLKICLDVLVLLEFVNPSGEKNERWRSKNQLCLLDPFWGDLLSLFAYDLIFVCRSQH
jgi:hypothetical protein